MSDIFYTEDEDKDKSVKTTARKPVEELKKESLRG